MGCTGRAASVPDVGEEYWFDLSGVNKTGQTLNPTLPDQTLTWVPFVYMGTVNAYVLNENSDGVTDASDEASKATDKQRDIRLHLRAQPVPVQKLSVPKHQRHLE